jgi:phosphatidylserine/phosphatidylglycerophosphate/cardiolipin synthase-like enzyme
VLYVENLQGLPVYVHSKLCVVDDVGAAVGSDNFNSRSWTHDSVDPDGRPLDMRLRRTY